MANRIIICALLALMVMVLFLLLWVTPKDEDVMQFPKHTFEITRGYIITLNADAADPLMSAAKRYLHISDMGIFNAVNGSQAMESGAMNNLSLYTQYLMISGFLIF
jgi:hypothetical protein